jgi:hypothetical protein
MARCAISMVLLALGLATSTGCGGGASSTGNTAHLQGAVTLAGQPLPADADGAITFRNATGKAITVPIAAGRYDSPATPKGAVKAYFSISKPTGKSYRSGRTGADVVETASIVPAKYGSGLDLEVSDDKPDQNFDLTVE